MVWTKVNYDELSRSTDMSCFSYTRSASGYLQYYDNKCLVLSCLVTQTMYFSQFFLRFFVYHYLFIAGKNWLCGYETWLKALFSWKKKKKTGSGVLNLVPGILENLILGLWNSKIFWESTPPDPPRRRGLTAHCWYSRLLYSNLLATSIIIETPELD